MKRRLSLVLALCSAVIMAASPVFAAQLIQTADIADGAITDAKISGVISSSKIDGVGLNADMVDGKHASDLLQKVNNVIVVAENGGDFTDPVSAINSISNASELNPYLIKLMPGVYNIGSNIFQMKPYVDIEGSGENVTRIKGSTTAFGMAVVMGASNSEIRALTIENVAPRGVAIKNDNADAVYSNITGISSGGGGVVVVNANSSSPIYTNVSVIASGNIQGLGNVGIQSDSKGLYRNLRIKVTDSDSNMGFYSSTPSDVVMSNVEIEMEGGVACFGIYNLAGTLTKISNLNMTSSCNISNNGVNSFGTTRLSDGDIQVNNGQGVVAFDGGVMEIINSEITSDKFAIGTQGSGIIFAVDTKVKGLISGVQNSFTCIDVVGTNYQPIVCP